MVCSLGVTCVLVVAVSLLICLQSPTNPVRVNLFGYIVSDATKAQQFAVVLATGFVFAIPGLLLATPSAKREFKDTEALLS